MLIALSSQTSLNIAAEQIVARQIIVDGIVQETLHELAPVPVLTSQISRPHAQADMYNFVPLNSSMIAITADNHSYNTFWYFKMFPWTCYTFSPGL